MSEAAIPRSRTDATAGDARPRNLPWRPWLRPVAAVVGPILLVVAGTLPVWGTTLQAPQYPKGLSLWFYGGRTEGPLREVNGLNHYIGMRPIDLSLVPELGLWPLAVVGSAAVFLAAILLRGWLGRLAAIVLLLGPALILADIQRWLIIFGSELDPTSALRLDPFVPLVVGPSTVWNFTVWAYPGPALVVMWLVALLAFGVRRFAVPGPPSRLALGAAAAGLLIAVVGSVAVVVPAVRGPEPETGGASVPAGTADIIGLVADAADHATVTVPAGRYDVHLEIDRPLTLVAGGAVVIDGGGRGSPVVVRADDVTVRGFTIVNTGGQGEEAAGIRTIDADRVTIEGNRFERFFTGISVNGGSAVRIVGNTFAGSGQVTAGGGHATADAGRSAGTGTGNATAAGDDPHAGHGPGAGPGGQGDAISIWSVDGALVRDNRIAEVRDAIYLNYVDEALVDGNVVDDSRYGVHAMFGTTITLFGNEARGNLSGLVLMYSTDVIAGRNILADGRSPGTGFGVVLKDVNGVRLAENLIAGNRVGIQAEGTVHSLDREASVTSNRLAGNDVGVALMPSAGLVFGGNVFDANLTQVAALGPGVERRNFWEFRGVGNTWSDYTGYDLANDGIGDIPYRSAAVEDVLVAANPTLAAYRTSPAMTVLATARSVWEGARPPVVTDPSPRRDQVGAAAVPVADRSVTPTQPWRLAGIGLLGAVLLLLAAPRIVRVAGPPGPPRPSVR